MMKMTRMWKMKEGRQRGKMMKIIMEMMQNKLICYFYKYKIRYA